MNQIAQLSSQIKALADGIGPSRPDAEKSVQFQAIVTTCDQIYGQGNTKLALGHALRAMGIMDGPLGSRLPLDFDPDQAAQRIDSAFSQKTMVRRHLCPLNLADDLPALAFGSAEMRQFNKDELGALFNVERLNRFYPLRPLQMKDFAQFQWLVVEETIEVHSSPDVRAWPILGTIMNRDFGEVAFHTSRLPERVEEALFFLLTAPWEDWSTMLEVEWRGFTIPWVYTVDEDLFARPHYPPPHDKLAMVPQFYTDYDGETIETERPETLDLAEGAAEALKSCDAGAWAKVLTARQSALFETPIEHFFVRAYLAEGVDEFMAHMTAIEAAVALESDHKKRLRPKPDKHNKRGATDCVAARAAELLSDSNVVAGYRDLFDIRSGYVHGRPGLDPLSTEKRVLARSIARRLVRALIDRANTDARPRMEIMAELLDNGVSYL